MDRDPVAVRALHRSRPAGADRPRAAGLRRRRRSSWSTTSTTTSTGINAYIAEALLDPSKMPAEYAALGKHAEPWKPTDVIAEASLIGGIFGKGGGSELDSALTLQAFDEALRQEGAGAQRLARLPLQERPRGADDGLRKRFPYETRSAVRQARPRAARPGLGPLHPGRRRQPPSAAPRRRRAIRRHRRATLQAALDGPAMPRTGSWSRAQAVDDRPPDRRHGPAGRLLRTRRS